MTQDPRVLAGHIVDMCVGFDVSHSICACGYAMVGLINTMSPNSENCCELVDDMAKTMKEWLRTEKVQ